MIILVTDRNEKKAIAERILTDIPEWFGIPEYTKKYIEESADFPFFAYHYDNKPVGFLTVKETSPYAAEIHCMGILKSFHRRGFGRELFLAFQKYAKKQGYKFIQVKTVEYGKYEEYNRTNLFYKSMGFLELEVLPTLWGEGNPCQILIKSLS